MNQENENIYSELTCLFTLDVPLQSPWILYYIIKRKREPTKEDFLELNVIGHIFKIWNWIFEVLMVALQYFEVASVCV